MQLVLKGKNFIISDRIREYVEKKIGKPIVSIVYDGTMNNKNDLLAPYLYYIQQTLSASSTE